MSADHGGRPRAAALLERFVPVLFLCSGLLRLGFITQFLSRPVMEGFVFGLAIFVAVGQLPKLFGLAKVPAGLPAVHALNLHAADLWVLLPSATGMMLVIFSEALGAAQTFADKHGYQPNPARR
jgi:MFS superfamily sulfate permease-like transporter